MRNINLIILHCSDSDIPSHDKISVIREWHLARGWKNVGYHYFIRKCGTIDTGRPEDEIGAHCKGFNKNSIGICLSGRSEFTEQQFLSAASLVLKLMDKYNLGLIDIVGHNEFSKKTCPNFKIEEVTKRIYGPIRK